jgi:hypothetical protein
LQSFVWLSMDCSKDNFRNNYFIFKLKCFIFIKKLLLFIINFLNNYFWPFLITTFILYLSLFSLIHQHLPMKQGSLFVLFCTDEIHWTGMLQITFSVSLESSRGQGVHRLGSMPFELAMQKFLNIESFLHWKLN